MTCLSLKFRTLADKPLDRIAINLPSVEIMSKMEINNSFLESKTGANSDASPFRKLIFCLFLTKTLAVDSEFLEMLNCSDCHGWDERLTGRDSMMIKKGSDMRQSCSTKRPFRPRTG
jgi:hypothetical protein